MIRLSGTGSVRDRLVDLGLVAVSALAGLAIASEAEDAGRLAGDRLSVALALAAFASLALWWRRRFPVAVAVLLTLLLAVTDLTIVAVLVAVYTVSASRRWSTTAAVVGFGMLVYVPYSVTMPGPDLSAFNANVVYVALISIAMAGGSNIRTRREAIVALQERADRAEVAAYERAERLRGHERHRIAGEMHDVLGHRISLVGLQAGALEVRSDLPPDVTEAAAAIRVQSHRTLEDLREILGVLRVGAEGTGLRPQPGMADLNQLVDEARSTGAKIQMGNRLAGTPSDTVGRTVYHLVQEGLTNARKHAPGAPVDVLLEHNGDGELHLQVRNPLVSGPRPAVPGSHSGLLGLAERVELAGGRFAYGARHIPDGAVVFQLEAWLP